MTHAQIPMKWLLGTREISYRSIETQKVNGGVLVTAKTHDGQTVSMKIEITEATIKK